MTLIFSLLAVAAALYLLGAVLICLGQERFIFPARHSKNDALVPPKNAAFSLTAPDQTVLEGFWRKTGSRDLLLWFEGNADNIHQVHPLLEKLPGIDAAGLNYRGYGQSGGRPGENALFEDAILLYDTLAHRYSRVFLLGRSLGTGVAAFLASQRPVDGLILVTPYDSVRALAGVRFPLWPFGFLVRHPFDSLRHLRGNTVAAAVLEVIGDRVIPNRNTRRLIDGLENLALYERIDGCTHGGIEEDERFIPFVQRALETFSSKEF